MGMIKGMTGFGSVQMSTSNVKAIIEIKSLNHRFFDINYYLPIGFGSIEQKIRQIVQRNIERGRVTVFIKILEKPKQSVYLNKENVRRNLKYANQLKKDFNLKQDMSVSELIKLPGVLETKESIINVERLWPSLEKSIRTSLAGVMNMRCSEGRSLAKDVADKLRRMKIQIKKIKTRANVIVRDKKKALNTEEYSSLVKSIDINEEVSRLTHYIDEMKVLLKGKVAIGKKIDFVAQEMQRETNTIGSKLQDKIVSNAVIALKTKIEKIREQSQNIE